MVRVIVCVLIQAVACLASDAASAQTAIIDGSNISSEFDGHGGLSAGATTRLLIDYKEPYRSQVLDYLFKPNFGASLAVLKVEIGGDTQSTDGTEASHMHSRDDLNCNRGYEGWLAAEAKARNPDIKIWSLAWGVPGWIGNGTYFSDDNTNYQIQWLKCLRESHGVESDYIGLWNERPQGSTDYVIGLRKALDANGFKNVGITVETTWQPLINQVLTNPEFNASVLAATKHYPCNTTSNASLAAHKKFWAGEDTPTHFSNWTAASCWGRKLNQHWIKMSATSAISWAVVWSASPGISLEFFGNAFLNAAEPWSGHYQVPPTLWMNAHWHQFAAPGWRFLAIGAAGGAALLQGGGSYVTLVPPSGGSYPTSTFSMIVETLDGSCGPQGQCNVDPITSSQTLNFELKGPLASAKAINLWCSNIDDQFVNKGSVTVSNSMLQLKMAPDTICTATTLSNGIKGSYPEPPASSPFPTEHADDFSNYTDDTLAWGFSDVYGSFAVRPVPTPAGAKALTQLATATPTGWAPHNYDPLTLIGDPLWNSTTTSVTAKVNSSNTSHYVRVCGGCGGLHTHGIVYACPTTCCFNVSSAGHWTIGEKEGIITGFTDDWHDITVNISISGALSASVDGKQVATVDNSCPLIASGMVGLGCGKYHMCGFRNFHLSGKSI